MKLIDGSKESTGEVALRDQDNPRSVINLVSEALRTRILGLPEDLLSASENELERLTPQGAFTLVDRRLRMAFWVEYARAQDQGKHMNIAMIYSGICTRAYFYTYVIENKPKLAYLLSPPADYRIAMEEALSYGVDRLREILDLPIRDPNGKPDPKVAKVILDAVQMIDQRVKGAVIQKIQQHNIHESMDKRDEEKTPDTMDEIDERLRVLQAKASLTRKMIPLEIEGETLTLDEDDLE